MTDPLQRVSMALQQQSVVPEVAIIDLTFLSPVPKEYRCMMCEHLMRDPCHVTCCKSRYCQKCVDRLVTSRHCCMNRRCQARFFSREVSREDKALADMITSLQVFCPMKGGGCRWTGRIKDLEAHLHWGEFDSSNVTNCRFLPVPCPMECGENVPRRDMEGHRQMSCDKRSVKCRWCSYEDLATVVETIHRPTCHKRIVECPLGCGMPGVKSTDLSHHTKEECPLRLVPCEHIGCGEQFCFKDRTEHNKQRFHEHFHLMSERVVALSQENEELRSLALSIQSTCNTLQEQYGTLMGLLVHRDHDEDEGEYLSMTGMSIFANTMPPQVPMREGTDPPTIHSRTESMRRVATSSFSENSGTDLPPPSSSVRSAASNLPSWLRKRPISFRPPRFSELVPSSAASTPDLSDLSEWNVLPLPPRKSIVFEIPPPPPTEQSPVASPPQKRSTTSSPPQKPSTASPAPYEPPVASLPTPVVSVPTNPPSSHHPLIVSPPEHPPVFSPPSQPTASPLTPSSPLCSPSTGKRMKKLTPPPPPPPRRSSIASHSFRRQSEPPIKQNLRNSLNASLPNLAQGEQRSSRTWSDTSMQSVDCNDSVSKRYETNTGCDQISISSSVTASSDFGSHFTDSYDSTLKAGVSSSIPFRRQCKSVEMSADDGFGSPGNHRQMSMSSDYINVSGLQTCAVTEPAYANTASNLTSFGNQKNPIKSESILELDDDDSDIEVASNPVYVRSPAVSASESGSVSHHRLLVNER